MPNLSYWKAMPETQHILNDVNEQIDTVGTSLIDGSAMSAQSDFQVIKDYYYNLGYFKGLNYLKSLLTIEIEEDKDDAST